jgi:hypothetical protein
MGIGEINCTVFYASRSASDFYAVNSFSARLILTADKEGQADFISHPPHYDFSVRVRPLIRTFLFSA